MYHSNVRALWRQAKVHNHGKFKPTISRTWYTKDKSHGVYKPGFGSYAETYRQENLIHVNGNFKLIKIKKYSFYILGTTATEQMRGFGRTQCVINARCKSEMLLTTYRRELL